MEGQKRYIKIVIVSLMLFAFSLTATSAAQIELNVLSEEPIYFSPGTGSPKDKAEIKYTLSQGARTAVEIKDEEGNLVHSIVNNRTEGGSITDTWDGKDTQGTIVGDGTYSYSIEALDSYVGKMVFNRGGNWSSGQINWLGEVLFLSNGYLVVHALDIAKIGLYSSLTTKIAEVGSGRGMDLDGEDNLYVLLQNEVVKYTWDGSSYVEETRFGGFGWQAGQLADARDIAVDHQGNVYVTEHGNKRIQIFAPDSGSETGYTSIIRIDDSEFNDPSAIFVDSQQNIYVANTGNKEIKKYSKDQDGNYSLAWSKDGFEDPRGLAVVDDGSIWVANGSQHQLIKLDSDGNELFRFGFNSKRTSYGSTDEAEEYGFNNAGRINYINGNLYVTDRYNVRLQIFDPTRIPASSSTHQIVVDTTKPVALLVQPTQGSILSGIVDIQGTVTDQNLKTFKVEMKKAGEGTWTLINSGMEGVQEGSLGQWNTTVVSDGNIDLRITAEDLAGNQQTASLQGLLVDNTAPVIEVVFPTEGGIVKSKQPQIAFKASDAGAGIYESTLQVKLNGTTQAWQYDAGLAAYVVTPTAPLPFGANTLEITVSDQAGNEAAVEVGFNVDTRLLLEADKAQLPANGSSQAIITITITDSNGAPLSNVVAEVSSTIGSITQPEPTDAAGKTTAILTSEQVVGMAVVTVKATIDHELVENNISIEFKGESLDVLLGKERLVADGVDYAMVTAVFLDEEGNPLAGEELAISATMGALESNVIFTDATGTATVKLVSGTKVGQCVISVRGLAELRGEIITTVVIPFIAGPPAKVAVDVAPEHIMANGRDTATIVISVWDQYDNPVGGFEVNIDTNLGTIPTTAVTDGQGQARVVFTAGLNPGTATVEVVAAQSRKAVEVVLIATDNQPLGIRYAQLSSNRITPRGQKDALTISYILGQNATITIEVYNLAGQLVKMIVPNEFRLAGSYLDCWDGTDEAGRLVANGIYLLRIHATKPQEIPVTVIKKILVTK